MRLCFNTKSAYIDFNMLVHDPFFVDKSDLIAKINMRIHTKNRYICITKPRRFEKLLCLICLVPITANHMIPEIYLMASKSANLNPI